jgi:hypothetical protein
MKAIMEVAAEADTYYAVGKEAEIILRTELTCSKCVVLVGSYTHNSRQKQMSTFCRQEAAAVIILGGGSYHTIKIVETSN